MIIVEHFVACEIGVKYIGTVVAVDSDIAAVECWWDVSASKCSIMLGAVGTVDEIRTVETIPLKVPVFGRVLIGG
jgi:hypothetical protein